MWKICSSINTNRNNMRRLVSARPNLKSEKTFAWYHIHIYDIYNIIYIPYGFFPIFLISQNVRGLGLRTMVVQYWSFSPVDWQRHVYGDGMSNVSRTILPHSIFISLRNPVINKYNQKKYWVRQQIFITPGGSKQYFKGVFWIFFIWMCMYDQNIFSHVAKGMYACFPFLI